MPSMTSNILFNHTLMIYLLIHEIRLITRKIWELYFYSVNTTKYDSIHTNVCFVLVLVICLVSQRLRMEFDSTHLRFKQFLTCLHLEIYYNYRDSKGRLTLWGGSFPIMLKWLKDLLVFWKRGYPSNGIRLCKLPLMLLKIPWLEPHPWIIKMTTSYISSLQIQPLEWF